MNVKRKSEVSRRRALVLGALGLLSSGCFALFSLDGYGPVDEIADATPTVEAGEAGDAELDAGRLDGRVVFVTSSAYEGTFDGGVNGADAICQELAQRAGLSGQFKAWLSATDGVRQRFPNLTAPGAFVSPDRRTLLFGSYEEIPNGPRAPIAMTEDKSVLAILPADHRIDCSPPTPDAAFVWTNTNNTGATQDSVADCERWKTDFAKGPQGWVGVLIAKDAGADYREWTIACRLTCNQTAHLYCFEQ